MPASGTVSTGKRVTIRGGLSVALPARCVHNPTVIPSDPLLALNRPQSLALGFLNKMPTLIQVLQRLPILVHTVVLFVAIFGRWLFPYFLAGLVLVTNVAFVSSQARMAYGMIR